MKATGLSQCRTELSPMKQGEEEVNAETQTKPNHDRPSEAGKSVKGFLVRSYWKS